MDFGENIRFIRKAKGLHVADVVERLKQNGVEIAQSTYYSWEDGTRCVPHKNVIPLCISLGVTVDFLYNVKHDSPMLDEKLEHVEAMKDFLCALDDDICDILLAIHRYWKGDIYAALTFLGIYSAQPIESRRDVADLCFHNFECAVRDGEADKRIADTINLDFARKSVEKLYK